MILDTLFKKGADAVIGSVGKAIDRVFTNDEERLAKQTELEKIKNEASAEINRHFEAIQQDATKQFELEIQDRGSARQREAEFVKATGHMDYIVWVLVVVALAIFGFMVFSVVKGSVPTENRELIFHIFGIVEGFLLSIFSYYFGSSAGSRIKDMKSKQQ